MDLRKGEKLGFSGYSKIDSGAIHFKGPTFDCVLLESSPSIWRLIPKSLIFGIKGSLFVIFIVIWFEILLDSYFFKKKIVYVNNTFLAAKSRWTIPSKERWSIPFEIPFSHKLKILNKKCGWDHIVIYLWTISKSNHH